MKDTTLQSLVAAHSIAWSDYLDTLKFNSPDAGNKELRKQLREDMEAAMERVHDYVQQNYRRV